MAFVLQLVVLVLCLAALWLFIRNFPYPSPLIKLLLPPQKRWPEAQIRKWAQSGGADKRFLKFFYRDPERTIPPGDSLVAPADGLLRETFVYRGTRYLVIALTFWDMHVQRSPAMGIVTGVEETGDVYTDGEGREMAFLREKKCPVQKIISLQTSRGLIRIRLITSLSARRIEVWAREGQTINRGDRIGRILMGSTVVLELPPAATLTVEDGKRVLAGETIIGDMPVEAGVKKRDLSYV